LNKRIAILTSSRADFGIYLPLLFALQKDSFFSFKIIAFGTHLSLEHGYTISEIEKEGFIIDYKLYAAQNSNNQQGISENYAEYAKLFSSFWGVHAQEFDLVFALGDRYEMAAAVMSSIPFGIKIAHIHAGETTLGAIDNVYRHCITLASSICFTSTDIYTEKVNQLTGNSIPVYNVGALSLDGIENIELPSQIELENQFKLDFSKPLILVVMHPETIEPHKNGFYINELLDAIELLPEYNYAINLPNADTNAFIIRDAILKLKDKNLTNKNISVIEHFGKRNYFACMKYASLIIGNSSSGIIEAASFQKYVLNIGLRQKGRAMGENIINCEFDKFSIMDKIITSISIGKYSGYNIYKNNKDVALTILNYLKIN
jgi:GDP/UDP-N,N'-diacetylbacillosamine 2-epimerase (hydrolysing)